MKKHKIELSEKQIEFVLKVIDFYQTEMLYDAPLNKSEADLVQRLRAYINKLSR
tara:strand:+ start:369 stop:530 length:162 start_codon:yes stop_codon:yes gene_type:complete